MSRAFWGTWTSGATSAVPAAAVATRAIAGTRWTRQRIATAAGSSSVRRPELPGRRVAGASKGAIQAPRRSLPGPAGLALLHEGARALGAVLGGAEQRGEIVLEP